MKKVAQEFKTFLLRGNVVDLAVGIVVGSSFGKIVTSLVNDIIMPPLGALIGKVNFSDLKIPLLYKGTAEEVAIRYGAFIQSILDFVIIGFAIFLVVKMMNAFKKKAVEAPKLLVPTREELLLEEIRDLLKARKI